MTWRKSVVMWTLVLLVLTCVSNVYSRPQDAAVNVSNSSLNNDVVSKTSDVTTRTSTSLPKDEETKIEVLSTTSTDTPSSARDVKSKTPVIGESMKKVANQLLDIPSNKSVDAPVVPDTRIPPKIKNQVVKHKIKTRHDDGDIEGAHAGVAVPVTIEELEAESQLHEKSNESSTSNEGISTWILLSSPNKENSTTSTEPTKTEEKKQKPTSSKNKTKRPQLNKGSMAKRPIIGSTNKSDLVAGGSALNENVYNKIKDTVLSNVQKNKNTSVKTTPTITTTTTTTLAPSTATITTKKESLTKVVTPVIPVVKITSKPSKKKNKNKHKLSTTLAPIESDSALLPMEPKEQEIELEISTPATTTKKPKRTSSKKKNKTKKRKTTKPKPEASSAVVDTKVSNKTKTTKLSKKPSNAGNPITTQIYNYLSREVMPSVGVGVIGLASLVGIASYFLYPFTTPVRRTFEVDKKDDIYNHNAEEYASEGNGQAEEEMLGTVLAGMPAHTRNKYNPYIAQTPGHVNKYPAKKEQNIRYRHVTNTYEPNYNMHYPQQKTGLAHGVVYSEPVKYNAQQYETRNSQTTESKYVYDKGPNAYTPTYPAVEPIYAAPQTGPSAISGYGSDNTNSVVYGVKPSSESEFKPVYPYEAQFYSETSTTSSVTYPPPTSMYLGSNNDEENNKYDESSNEDDGSVDNKFVVGNVPKELAETATPAVVPEHGPRKLNRKKRNARISKRGFADTIEELLKAAKENKEFMSNEIDETLALSTKASTVETIPSNPTMIPVKNDIITPPDVKDVFPVYAVSSEPMKEETLSKDLSSTAEPSTTSKNDIVESISTIPIDSTKQEGTTTTEADVSSELEGTTKTFRVYEVFSTGNPTDTTKNSPITKEDSPKSSETTTQLKNMNTETTTEFKSETTSTMPPSPSPIFESKDPDHSSSTKKPTTNLDPSVITYPPANQDGNFFTFLKRLIEFKYRLGLSLLQSTSESLNRYLRSLDNTVQKMAKASRS